MTNDHTLKFQLKSKYNQKIEKLNQIRDKI